jgi:hypothetical protein
MHPVPFSIPQNVFPKATTLSTYSYRVTRAQNRNFLVQRSRIFRDEELENGEFNLLNQSEEKIKFQMLQKSGHGSI